MDAGRIGYLLVLALVRFLCALSDVLDRFFNAVEAAWFYLVGATSRLLSSLCQGLSALPIIGWLAGIVCDALRIAITAAGSLGGGVFIITHQFVMAALAGVFYVTVLLAMSLAWGVHWALSRTVLYKECVNAKSEDKLTMRINFVVLMLDKNTPNITDQRLDEIELKTADSLRQCDIVPRFTRSFVTKREYATRVDYGMMFTPLAYQWFMCHSSNIFEPTVFFVEDFSYPEKDGITFPVLTNFVFVRKSRPDRDVQRIVTVHELGHLGDIWPHTNLPDWIMNRVALDSYSHFSRHQCCLIRTSRFTRRV